MTSRFSTNLLICAALVTLTSCSFRSNSYQTLKHERDSLLNVMHVKDSVADAMNDYLEVISSSLDSIKVAEDIYSLSVDKDGRKLKRAEIKDNLNLLEDVIHRQRSRIEELETRLKESQDTESKYKVLIANLYAQIDEKDARIRRMQADLAMRDKQIAALNTQVTIIKQDLASAEEKNKEQGEVIEYQSNVLATQDKIANTGYIISGTKRELQQMGVLDRSLIPRIQSGNWSQESATQVDMREFREISFKSPRLKVLSAMPSGSYSIINNFDGTTLTVKDPGLFWSITSFLVIQL